MELIKVRVTYIEPLLGTASADPEIHKRFIASKAPDAKTIDEEVAAVGAEEVTERSMTVFPRDENGNPYTYDYQWKGFFKDSCGMLKRAKGYKSNSLKAYKKEIDGLVFVHPRRIVLNLPEGGEITSCERPLRASTPQGERVALSNSEQVPAGTTQEFTITLLGSDAKSRLAPLVYEWLEYGYYHGTGQWRNSGKGSFVYELLDKKGNVIGGNKETYESLTS